MADDDWDNDDGMPGTILLAKAVQVWTILQKKDKISVAKVANVFNCSSWRIKDAVQSHPYMYLTDEGADYELMYIEHDGE